MGTNLLTVAGVEAAAGTDRDAIGGVRPPVVLRARTGADVATALAAVSSGGLSAVVRGNGTKSDFANPPSALDVVLDVSALDGVVEFAPDDLVVRVQAGMRMDTLRGLLGDAGLRLAIDETVPGSTVGGVIATGLSGPLRYGFGAVRDLLIGVTVVRADGVTTRAGGKVVKNVAGYDLCKLYTGSFGTLGVLTEATFRLHPLPEAVGYVSAAYPDPAAAASALRELIASPAVPAAIELDRPRPGGPLSLAVLIEGSAAGVRARVDTTARQLGVPTETATTPPPWWGALPGATTIRLTCAIDETVRLAAAIDAAAGELALDAQVRGSAGTGALYVGLPPGAPVAELLARVRGAAQAAGGFATVMRAAPSVRATVDAWGPVPAIDLMRRVKASFDPGNHLAPGRFVGGI